MREKLALALVVIPVVGLMLMADWLAVVNPQEVASPSAKDTPLGLAPAEPSARATKNPHLAHHHFDVRRPHRSTRPTVASPVESPDPAFNGGPNVNKPQEH